MNFKSILLMAPLALAASTAMAADVVEFEPEAAVAPQAIVTPASGGVAICDTMGVGFFNIPGTDTCMRIGGEVEVSFGYLSLIDGLLYEDAYGNVQARMDIDALSESELGLIGGHIRISALGNYFQGPFPTRGDIGVEHAYLSVGPAYAGFKETLFNKNVAYGDMFSVDAYGDRFGFGSNAYTIGAMVDNIGGGFYAGAALESFERSKWIDSISDAGNPDIIARVGLAGQTWGGTDLSVAYSDEADSWLVKSTTDLDVLDATQARLTVAYFDASGSDAWLLAAGVKHGFTDKIDGFAGLGYVINSDIDDPIMANIGVEYTPIENLDVIGEFGYGDLVGTSNYVGKVKVVKSW